MKRDRALLLCCAFNLLCEGVAAEGLTFGIAGKRLDDINFIRVWEGCNEEAEKHGDRCVLIGSEGPAHFRRQDKAILEAIHQNLDALALSVTNSEWLANSSLEAANKKGIPIITFDSDLDPPHQHLRQAHVGIDNEQFGRLLATLVQRARPQGGELCLMTGDDRDPNLHQRVKGVRDFLRTRQHQTSEDRSSKHAVWTENARCPWFTRDSQDTALRQIEFTFNKLDANVIVSVGHWPVINPALFLSATRPLQRQHPEKLIFVGVGTPLPGQLDLLKHGLAAGMVSIDFRNMGSLSYLYMRKVLRGESVDPIVHLPANIVDGQIEHDAE